MNIRHLRKGLLGTNLLLTGLIVWMAVIIFLGWNSEEPKAGSSMVEESVKDGPGERSSGRMMNLAAYQKIIQGDIFDTVSAAPKAVAVIQQKEEEILPTQLNLRLKGTMLGDGTSYAVIADGRTNQEQIYARDESVQNARIADILSDRVILEINNKKEALVLFPQIGDKNVEIGDAAPQGRSSKPPAVRRPPTKNIGVNRLPRR